MRLSLRTLLIALFILPFSLAGCDAIEEAAGLNDIDVSLGNAGDDIPVTPNVTASKSGSVDIGRDIPGSPGVDDIKISASDVTFTPAAGRGAARGAASCDLDITLIIDDAPAAFGSFMIVDDVLTEASVDYLSTSYDRDAICAALGAVPCTVSDQTRAEIKSTVEAAVDSGSFDVDWIVSDSGQCSGSLDIDKINIDLSL